MTTAARTTKVPPLLNGDHLSVAEFERRYRAMPQVKKAELIEGVVYMPSPVSHRRHGVPHAVFLTWVGVYVAGTPGTEHADNSTVRLELGANLPQPDGLLLIRRDHGGQAKIDTEGYLSGAPELLGEIAASSVSYDLHEKLAAYQRNGVREYVVWRVEDEEVDWFVLQRGKFRALKPNKDGLYLSKTFPGLWLDPQALVQGDLARVLQVVQEGLASAEHRQFVTKLQAKKK